MLGFKRFENAAVTISGIELAEKIKKGPVQDRQARWLQSDHVRTVERGARRLTPSRALNAAKPSKPRPWLEFAPEP
jgi:uncharacterized protein YifN (PemK superfamily)